MKRVPLYVAAFLIFSSCVKESKQVENNTVVEVKKLSRHDYSNRNYQFCMNLDTALAHPLEVKVLYLRDTLPGDSLPVAIKSLKNLTDLELSTIPTSRIEDALEMIKSFDSLKVLSIYDATPDLNGEIKNFRNLEELRLINTGIKEIPINFLADIKVAKLTIDEDSFKITGEIERGKVSTIKGVEIRRLYGGYFK